MYRHLLVKKRNNVINISKTRNEICSYISFVNIFDRFTNKIMHGQKKLKGCKYYCRFIYHYFLRLGTYFTKHCRHNIFYEKWKYKISIIITKKMFLKQLKIQPRRPLWFYYDSFLCTLENRRLYNNIYRRKQRK